MWWNKVVHNAAVGIYTWHLYCCVVPQCEALRTCCLPFQSQQSGALTRMWRWCQVQPSHKERAIGTVHCKNEMLLHSSVAVALKCCFRMPISQSMKMTRDEHVLGFKSCDISIYWWIWMLSFLLKEIWIGIDYFLWTTSQLSVQFWDCRLQ